MMRSVCLGGGFIGPALRAVVAQDVVREFSWSELKKAGELSVGDSRARRPSGPRKQLKIDNPVAEERRSEDGRTTYRARPEQSGLSQKALGLWRVWSAIKDIKCKISESPEHDGYGSHFADDKPSYLGPAISVGEIGKDFNRATLAGLVPIGVRSAVVSTAICRKISGHCLAESR